MKRFKVYRVYRNSCRRVLIETNLTEGEAQRVVKQHPTINYSMVVYTAMY